MKRGRTRPFSELADEVKAGWNEETWVLYNATVAMLQQDSSAPLENPAAPTE